ncbi:hypothetical protein P5673_003975 [Acropora cervicornis]|uniref:Uncharacterized protein n=1 Tax=Acropora cervicornis TaxID=6130 RepID=A0AAD9R276_ACRCE|nr:hypothetical protein P5673_003975 [Acropora cervicornis]
MLREEDELSGTWESEGEDEDAGPDPHGMESEINLTEVDMSDMDMNKVKVLSPPKLEPTVEDKEFLAAFDKIPVSSGLAASIKDRQLAEQQEQEEVKRLVLDYNQRQEEEIYNEMLAEQRQSMADQAPRSHHRTHKKRLPEGNDTSLVFANLTRLVRLLHSKFYNKDFLGLVSRLKQKWSKLRRLYIPNKTLLRAVSLKTPLFQTVFMSLKNKFMRGVSIRPGAECSVHPLLAVFCHRHWCVAAQMGRHVVLIDGLGCPLSSTAVGLGKKKSSGVSFPSSKLVKK